MTPPSTFTNDRTQPNQAPDGFTAPTAISAEGARIGIVSCFECGAAILLDPRDTEDMLGLHRSFHAELAR